MSAKKRKRNVYEHAIDLKQLKIVNAPRSNFAKELETIPYRGYEVEQLADGRKVVITKPGGKTVYGHPKKEDFLVLVYDPTSGTLWQITHNQIFEDLELKAAKDPQHALVAIAALKRVHGGDEPDVVLKDVPGLDVEGESIEVLLKVYKWIWGQEDVNYPTGRGRDMSMEGILGLEASLLDAKK